MPRDGHIIKTMYIIQLWLETPARQLDRTFSYVFSRPLAMGTRVLVQFHKRKQIGFVESCQPLREPLAEYEKKQGFQLSAIQDVWDTDSLLTKELHDLALWMRQTTLSTTIRCFATMLPAKVKPAHRRQTVVMETCIVNGKGDARLSGSRSKRSAALSSIAETISPSGSVLNQKRRFDT